MLKLTIIGNLGSDAELRTEQGQKFVSLSIAHTEKRREENGNTREHTTWVSATINGDGGNLLPYLKRGTTVYAYGDMGLRTYHSERERKLVAGVNLYIRNIELVGGSPDIVPRDLYDQNGVAYRCNKYYYTETGRNIQLYSRRGEPFQVDANGWVSPVNVNPIQEQTVNEPEQTEPKKKKETMVSSDENNADPY